MDARKDWPRLHNYIRTHRLGELSYEDQLQPIPGNRGSGVWTSTVQINGEAYGKGQGGTKQEARNNAAAITLSILLQLGGFGESTCQRLYNYIGTHGLGELVYDDQLQLIPGNRGVWTSTVQINGTSYGRGQGGTKQEARDRAVHDALVVLQTQFEPDDEI